MISRNKVFGIGMNKTGTKTLGECFRLFGFRNKSYDGGLLRDFARKDFSRIYEVADSYDSFEDWPWPLLYREFSEIYPDAKFILTMRATPEIWFRSLCRHANLTGPTEARVIVYGHAMPHDQMHQHIGIYNRHNEEVIRFFAARPERLLAVSWDKGDGWEQVCRFLGVDIPAVPFPHENKGMVAG